MIFYYKIIYFLTIECAIKILSQDSLNEFFRRAVSMLLDVVNYH